MIWHWERAAAFVRVAEFKGNGYRSSAARRAFPWLGGLVPLTPPRESLRYPQIRPNQRLDKLVTHRLCHLRAMCSVLTGYQTAWWSCRFEHFANLDDAIQFVINSVNRCPKTGSD